MDFLAALPTYTPPADWTEAAITALLWGAAAIPAVLAIGTGLFTRGVAACYRGVAGLFGGKRIT